MSRALPGSAALAAAFLVAGTLGGCASGDSDDPDGPAPQVSDEERTDDRAEATDDPDTSVEPEDFQGDVPEHTDWLSRPLSWPPGLGWTLVDGEVENYAIGDDGAIRLVISADEGEGPRKMANRLVTELKDAAHSVTAVHSWDGGEGNSVINAEHPNQAVQVRVRREAVDDAVQVQILLTPLNPPNPAEPEPPQP